MDGLFEQSQQKGTLEQEWQLTEKEFNPGKSVKKHQLTEGATDRQLDFFSKKKSRMTTRRSGAVFVSGTVRPENKDPDKTNQYKNISSLTRTAGPQKERVRE